MSTLSSTDNTLEEWLPVVGYESVYEVSDLGRVRRIVAGRGTRPGTTSGRVLKPAPGGGKSGQYLHVKLSWEGKRKTCRVHIMVAQAFLSPAPEDETGAFEVHHKDLDVTNNRADNLEYRSGRAHREEQWHKYITEGVANP